MGFKSLARPIDVDIAPLTLLCGSNSSGKSSFMQPLLLLKQTLESPYDPGPLLLSGSNVDFASASEMFWSGKVEAEPGFKIQHIDRDGEMGGAHFLPAPHGVELISTPYRLNWETETIHLRPGVSVASLLPAMPKEWRQFLDTAPLDFEVRRSRCFFDISPKNIPGELSFGPQPYLRRVASNLLHLPGLRDNPERFYPATQVGPAFPGAFQPYVASVIQAWTDAKDPRLKVLGNQLKNLGLTWKVETKRVDDTRVAVRVGRLPSPQREGSRDMVNIVDVGLGVSQLLPVLVALLVAEKGQHVLLEQPEIHLHPRAQVALAEPLIDAALRGVRVITETHSYLLLKAIQEAVLRRSCPANLVRLHWFSRDETGATEVQAATIGADGAYGDWPADFAAVEMEIEDRYLDALFSASAKKKG